MINWQPGMTLDYLEEQAIRSAFSFYRNNKTATASSLGISIRTLDSKLEIYKGKDDELQRKTETDAADLKARVLARQNEGQRNNSEPTSQNSAQQPVPMPKREEVQKVPQANNPRVSSPQRR